MSLKDTMLSDLDSVFFKADSGEFAEIHNINGKSMSIIIDEDLISVLVGKLQDPEGIFKSKKTVLVRVSEFGSRPKPGSIFILDGEKFKVFDANVTGGDLYLIVLESFDHGI